VSRKPFLGEPRTLLELNCVAKLVEHGAFNAKDRRFYSHSDGLDKSVCEMACCCSRSQVLFPLRRVWIKAPVKWHVVVVDRRFYSHSDGLDKSVCEMACCCSRSQVLFPLRRVWIKAPVKWHVVVVDRRFYSHSDGSG
jgi:hypothetical protein